jgi:hypothetical protein
MKRVNEIKEERGRVKRSSQGSWLVKGKREEKNISRPWSFLRTEITVRAAWRPTVPGLSAVKLYVRESHSTENDRLPLPESSVDCTAHRTSSMSIPPLSTC